SICPPVPTPTVTRLAIACRGACAPKFRFDAVGMVTPAGKTVRKLGAVACAAVTFKTTALALAGTPSFALSPTVTRLGTIVPAAKFRLETVGIVVPAGKTVKKPAAVGSTAVTLSTAAAAPTGTVPA